MGKIITLFLLSLTLQGTAQQLSAEEKNLVDYINSQLPQTMTLLEQLVNINSGTLNTEGVKKVGAILPQINFIKQNIISSFFKNWRLIYCIAFKNKEIHYGI